MAHESAADGCLERFIALTKLARLTQRQANQSDDFSRMVLIAEASTARERAVGYTAECIAQEIYKRQPTPFCPDVQARFSALGRIIDQYIQPGPQALEQRRALIERAEKFAGFSPHVEGHDETDDNQGIADQLNAIGSENLFRSVRAREVGGHRLLRLPFRAQRARELTDELGRLHQEFRDRLRTIDHLFSDESNDRVATLPQEIAFEVEAVSRRLESKQVDPTLARIDAEARKQKERLDRATSSSLSPMVAPERSSR
ncbi:MAG: hypothetical protein EOS23_30810 [Mesorhizobium sp.]|nr:MAG: hypothetical protein EOQ56_33985 [Mesorhizobium sp.]RWE06508.1 MAG: hypothetical protein EOS23_30810 [Mesorhizobium sp.]